MEEKERGEWFVNVLYFVCCVEYEFFIRIVRLFRKIRNHK